MGRSKCHSLAIPRRKLPQPRHLGRHDLQDAVDFVLGNKVALLVNGCWWHVCPTCALHRQAYVVENGQVVGQWEIAARDRVLSV